MSLLGLGSACSPSQRCQQGVGEGWIPSLVSPPPTSPCPQQSTLHYFRKKMWLRDLPSAPLYFPASPLLCFVLPSPPTASKWCLGFAQHTFCSAARGERLEPCVWCVELRHHQPQPGLTCLGVRGELWVKDSLPQHWFKAAKIQSCSCCVLFTGVWVVLHRQNAVSKYTPLSYSSWAVAPHPAHSLSCSSCITFCISFPWRK